MPTSITPYKSHIHCINSGYLYFLSKTAWIALIAMPLFHWH